MPIYNDSPPKGPPTTESTEQQLGPTPVVVEE